jgi:predicted transposase YbfD/YdcC
MNLIEQLQQIPDYRNIKGLRHELWLVLLLILLGAMTGYWGYRPLEDFTVVHRENLIKLLCLEPTVKFPSYSTFRRILQNIDFQPLTDIFNSWAQKLLPAEPGERLAIDGKSIRCTVTNYNESYQSFISVVSVYSHQRGIVLRMQPMSNKCESEIAIVKQLIQEFQGKQVVFTLDSLHCQKKTVEQIISSGNDYLIGLKANQPTLYNLAQSQLLQDNPLSCATAIEHHHSRTIQRQCKVFAINDKLQQKWAGLKAFVVVERVGIRDGQPWHEQQFYISSQIRDAQQLLADTVGHWGIENRLHWVRDVTFSEDFPPRCGGNAPVNWAILHNLFITIARFLGYRTIPQAQRALSNQFDRIFSLLV